MNISFSIPKQLERDKAYTWVASFCGLGFLHPGPGTWGSLGALLLGAILYDLGGVEFLFIGLFLAVGGAFWTVEKFDKKLGNHDSKMIVIDEVIGQLIALLPAQGNIILMLLSFLAFRFFDIVKPWPVMWFDQKVKGATGVIADDIVAGALAAGCILLMQIVFIDHG